MTESQGEQGGFDQGQQIDAGTVDNSAGTASSVNPAWNDLLGIIPSQLHSQVTPHLQQWDSNFQNKVNEVHSQYEAWKPFIDGGVTADDVNYGLGLINAISTNPQEVLQTLQEWVNQENGIEAEQQGQIDTPQSQEFDITQHPEFQRIQQQADTMAEILLGFKEQEQQALQDQQLEQDLQSLHEQHGAFDDDLVISYALQNEIELEDAVKAVQERIAGQQRQPGPPVLGSGGASPNSASLNPRNLDSKDTKSLVAQMLAQAKGQ